ncbi:MAG: winged helix-turn-helix transcriptional regulator [Clostridia bacterium]|nr:winged helix-turn-helix transcriptional regulator [Clostridia bacterium]
MEQDRLEAFSALITGASRSITKLKNIQMAHYGLGSTHTVCIRKLYAAPEGLTRKQLSEACELDKAQISRVICELSEKDYVAEDAGRSSYRKRILLTDSGKRIAAEINSIILDVNNFVSGDIPSEELKVFYDVFTRICERLKQSEDIVDGQSDRISLEIN